MSYQEIAVRIVSGEIMLIRDLYSQIKDEWEYRPQKNAKALVKALSKSTKEIGKTATKEQKIEVVVNTLQEFFHIKRTNDVSPMSEAEQTVESTELANKKDIEDEVKSREIDSMKGNIALPEAPTPYQYAAKQILECYLENKNEIPFEVVLRSQRLSFRKGKELHHVQTALDRASRRKCDDETARMELLAIGLEKVLLVSRKLQNIIS